MRFISCRLFTISPNTRTLTYGASRAMLTTITYNVALLYIACLRESIFIPNILGTIGSKLRGVLFDVKRHANCAWPRRRARFLSSCCYFFSNLDKECDSSSLSITQRLYCRSPSNRGRQGQKVSCPSASHRIRIQRGGVLVENCALALLQAARDETKDKALLEPCRPFTPPAKCRLSKPQVLNSSYSTRRLTRIRTRCGAR